jgi:hypothetical protein
MASFQVRMTAAYAPPRTREVSVPDNELTGTTKLDLDLIFKYGQNDFQPMPICSVSVADVIEYQDKLYLVMPSGFRQITAVEYEEFIDLPVLERQFCGCSHGTVGGPLVFKVK